ncbi:arsenate reductase (glutaredoxin) [Polaribacter sp. Hel_I_88]|uniref:arsenate reductase (glutaredoxin) n=1 Tax=Polaribacter sp. Hel_I_88 TaxID=1250006 RepID=UPI00068B200D|nr:arsenate reductase (glutaredoxin) [Polaribacter sp. Hel_I_88]
MTKTKDILPLGERGLLIFHNPRCRKSREGLQILENSGQEFEIVKYLEDVPSETELKEIIEILEIFPIQLIRKTEKIWKEEYKGKELSDSEIIKAMVQNPKLIERPIVINHDKAVIGRPPENIKSIL